MSARPDTPQKMTEAEYLEFERTDEFKHEFMDGDVFAMTGASEAHNLISGNLMMLLKIQLRGRPCKVYPSDMRVQVKSAKMYAYPDLSIVCGEAQLVDEKGDMLVNPTVVIEVLSPSTERFDRGEKFQRYRKLPSLQEYVLISQDSPRIERFLRRDDGQWIFTDVIGLDATITLPSIDCELALADVYEQVTFEDSAHDSQSSQ